MGLISLDIENVRCIESLSFAPNPACNLFVGQNGSGKTSILEAIHILGLGRSFRHSQILSAIRYHQPSLSVSGMLDQHRVGLQKTNENKTLIRIDHESVNNIATLAKLMPLQLIHPDSDELILGSSRLRRQFMDWGMFHVEHQFLAQWKKANVLLKQRNAALKSRASREEIAAWNALYAPLCEEISQLRARYIEYLTPYFQEFLTALSRVPNVILRYRCGWSEAEPLTLQLEKTYYRDSQTGHTSLGSHRDEVDILCGEHLACDVLSRGEQKLVVVALKLAQVKLLYALTQKACIFLIDDFSAELDEEHRFHVIQGLANLQSQVFLTSIDLDEVKSAFLNVNLSTFHVEHGHLNEV